MKMDVVAQCRYLLQCSVAIAMNNRLDRDTLRLFMIGFWDVLGQ